MQNIKKRYQAGFSLVSVVVATGIMGIVGVVFTQMMSNQFSSTAKIKDNVDIIDLKRTLSALVNCKKTIEPSGTPLCPSRDILKLYDKNGDPLGHHDITFEGGHQLAGNWFARTTCAGGTSDQLEIRVAKISFDSEQRPVAYFHDPLFKDELLNYVSPKMNPLYGLPPNALSICNGGGDDNTIVELRAGRKGKTGDTPANSNYKSYPQCPTGWTPLYFFPNFEAVNNGNVFWNMTTICQNDKNEHCDVFTMNGDSSAADKHSPPGCPASFREFSARAIYDGIGRSIWSRICIKCSSI